MWPFLLAVVLSWLLGKLPSLLPWEKQCTVSEIEAVPEVPGVYILYNRRGKLIHVGHSGNLRRRLSSHPKRKKIHRFDWCRIATKQKAYNVEMKLQKKHGYDGR